MFKNWCILLLVFIFLINLISAQTIVQTDQQSAPTNFMTTFFNFLKSPIFLGIIVFVILIVIVGVIVIILFRWIIKYIKLRSDVFYKLKTERLKLAKIHKRYPSKYWWNVEKNTPLRLVKKDENGKLFVSSPIAFHRGDYLTHEGNVILALNFRNKKKWFIFPITDILIVPNNKEIKVSHKNKEGKIIKTEIIKLPQANDIIKFGVEEILIYAESLSNTGMFYIPVLKSKEGNIIDLSMPIYQSLKNVIVGEYLYEQTASFVGIAKKSMDLNPYVRAITKTQDNSQSVEIPQELK